MGETLDFATLIKQARAAAGLDAARAATLAAELRARAPADPAGYQIGLAATRELRQWDAFSSLLAAAIERFPTQPWPLAEAAWGAIGKRGFAEAGQLAAAIRRFYPDHSAGYQVGVIAARETGAFAPAASLLAESVKKFPKEAWPLAESAGLARARGEPAEAARLAAVLREKFPQNPAGYQIGASLAEKSGDIDTASAILSEAIARLPELAWPLTEAARLARARGDLSGAAALASELRARFPQTPAGYHVGAAVARELGQWEAAAACVTEAQAGFPEAAWPLEEAGWLARARGDLPHAAELAAALRDRFPGGKVGYQLGSLAALEQKDFATAAAILAEADPRFAAEAWHLETSAWTALGQGDPEQALTLASTLRAKFPAALAGYRTGISVLRQQYRLAEADALLTEAAPLFAGDSWVAGATAELGPALADQLAAESLIERLTAPPPVVMPEPPAAKTGFLAKMLAGRGGRAARAAGSAAGKEKLVVVLGMHRAGTSLCARLVQQLGISLGGPLVPSEADPLVSSQAHQTVQQCHDALQTLCGTRWDTAWLARLDAAPAWGGPDITAIRTRLQTLAAEQLTAGGGGWVFKDPRTVHFLPLWQKIFAEIGVTPRYVLALRDPRSVAAALLDRNAMPLARGELLWADHYLEALRHVGADLATIIQYEEWFTNPLAQAERLGNAAGGLIDPTVTAAEVKTIHPDQRRPIPDSVPFQLPLAETLYARLLAPQPDLAQLQRDAASVWQMTTERFRPAS